jgi:predicted DNA binding protein
MGFKDGRIRFTFVGTQRQVRTILDGAEERGLLHRVVLLTDADFAEDSLLNRLTEKQRRILVLAYRLGYFDVPRKVKSDEVADRLGLTGSTVVEHLNKAERRLLAAIIDET